MYFSLMNIQQEFNKFINYNVRHQIIEYIFLNNEIYNTEI